MRKSGEPYLAHPLEVAHILAGFRLDAASLAVALLHGHHRRHARLQPMSCGCASAPTSRAASTGVTKLGRIAYIDSGRPSGGRTSARCCWQWPSDHARHSSIKLADRLHNMRTLASIWAARTRSASEFPGRPSIYTHPSQGGWDYMARCAANWKTCRFMNLYLETVQRDHPGTQELHQGHPADEALQKVP